MIYRLGLFVCAVPLRQSNKVDRKLEHSYKSVIVCSNTPLVCVHREELAKVALRRIPHTQNHWRLRTQWARWGSHWRVKSSFNMNLSFIWDAMMTASALDAIPVYTSFRSALSNAMSDDLRCLWILWTISQCRIVGNLNRNGYITDVLKPKVVPGFQRFSGAVFQQGNACPHAAKYSQTFFIAQQIQLLHWIA